MQDFDTLYSDKMRADDRVITLELIPGQKPTNSTGLVDTRLFKGGNRLHAIRNKHNHLWSMRYDSGGLPEPLKQQFTSFNKLIRHVEDYFGRRGLRIASVED